jgi:hypothetical protein
MAIYILSLSFMRRICELAFKPNAVHVDFLDASDLLTLPANILVNINLRFLSNARRDQDRALAICFATANAGIFEPAPVLSSGSSRIDVDRQWESAAPCPYRCMEIFDTSRANRGLTKINRRGKWSRRTFCSVANIRFDNDQST